MFLLVSAKEMFAPKYILGGEIKYKLFPQGYNFKVYKTSLSFNLPGIII